MRTCRFRYKAEELLGKKGIYRKGCLVEGYFAVECKVDAYDGEG
jgi:hypothetical protein